MNRFAEWNCRLLLRAALAVGLFSAAAVSWGAQPDGTNAPPRNNFEPFKIIVDRNIFNANRTPGGGPPPKAASGPRARPGRTEVFRLVGTLSYEKGKFAFFDGSNAQYRKSVRPSETIASFRVTDISQSDVTLEAGTNGPAMKMAVGMEMKKQEEGPWKLGVGSGSSFSSPAAPSTSSPSAGGPAGESEIERRMRLRREQETK